MKSLLRYLLDRLKEASTWRGLTLILTSFGVTLSPELLDGIVATGLAVTGLIGVFFKDKVPPEAPNSVVKQ